jgi:hypothetical protein
LDAQKLLDNPYATQRLPDGVPGDVLVHPYFTGCLTLELVNSGEIPIELVPGERIAQLLFSRVTASKPPRAKYNYPTRPEFSKVRDDYDLEPLTAMRDLYNNNKQNTS